MLCITCHQQLLKLPPLSHRKRFPVLREQGLLPLHQLNNLINVQHSYFNCLVGCDVAQIQRAAKINKRLTRRCKSLAVLGRETMAAIQHSDIATCKWHRHPTRPHSANHSAHLPQFQSFEVFLPKLHCETW